MSRPRNPDWVVPIFAPDTAYPTSANPWSNTPTKTTHAGASSVGFTPKTGVPAQVMNKLFYDAYTIDGSTKTWAAAITNYVGQVPALNFVMKASAANLDKLLWSEGARQWLGCGGTDTARFSADGGVTWSAFALPAGGKFTTDIDANAAGQYVVAWNVGAGGVYEFNGAAWSTVAGLPGATAVAQARVVFSLAANLCNRPADGVVTRAA